MTKKCEYCNETLERVFIEEKGILVDEKLYCENCLLFFDKEGE